MIDATCEKASSCEKAMCGIDVDVDFMLPTMKEADKQEALSELDHTSMIEKLAGNAVKSNHMAPLTLNVLSSDF